MTSSVSTDRRPTADGAVVADEATSAVSDMFGRGSLYTLVFASQTVTNVVATPLITRSLGSSEFGRVAAIMAIGQVIQVLASLGLHAGIQRHYADEAGDAESRGLLSVAVIAGLAITAVVFATSWLWSGSLGFGSPGAGLFLAVWWAGTGAIAVTLASFLRSQDRLGAFLLVMGLQGVGGQGVGLAIELVMHQTATEYFGGLLLGQGAGVAVGLLLTRPSLRGLRQRRVTSAALRFSVPLMPHMLAGLVLNAGDRIVVQRDLGSAAVGRYQLAYNAAGTIVLLLFVLNQAWEPRIYAVRNQLVRRQVLAKARDQLYRLEVPLLVGTVLAAPLLLRILGSRSYHPGGLLTVFLLVALSAVPYAAYLAELRTIMVHRRTAHLAWLTPLCAVVNIVLNVFLVPLWGINGSALATVLAFALLAVMARGMVSRFTETLPTPWAVKVGLGLAVAIGVALCYLPGSSALALTLRLGGCALCAGWTLLQLREAILPDSPHPLAATLNRHCRLRAVLLGSPAADGGAPSSVPPAPKTKEQANRFHHD